MSGPTLTEFQQRTASYVDRRFWEDGAPAMRFLVADEVGLGKTIIAREIIDRLLVRFANRRLDIVYLCSNSAIAAQNLDRLKKRGGRKAKATRLTLLAIDAGGQGRVRFFAITPDTSFRLTRSSGTVRERTLIFQALRRRIRPTGLEALLRMGVKCWDDELDRVSKTRPDRRILRAFRDDVMGDEELKTQIRQLAKEARQGSSDRAFREQRKKLIGELRRRLADISADMLARTGLVIVDEFQRFANLLHGNEDCPSTEQRLARRILSDRIADRRTLLLSATPYRLPGTISAAGESPYEDFVGLMRFLAGDAQAARLKDALTEFSRALRARPPVPSEVEKARDDAQAILRRVMARTERGGLAANPDELIDPDIASLESEEDDLRGAIAARRIARRLKVADPVEYWKSAPFCLEFMRDYQLRRTLAAPSCSTADRRFVAAEAARGSLLLDVRLLRRFGESPNPNARLRHLVATALPAGSERLLWVPPSLPYLRPAGPFATASGALKRLIFTEWRLAPDAISVLVSYEAERRLHAAFETRRAGKRKRRRALDRRHDGFGAASELLRLLRSGREGREGGLVHTALALLMPAVELGEMVDPLAQAIERGEPVAADEMARLATRAVAARLKGLPSGPAQGRVDERWYWAAPLLIDVRRDKKAVKAWLEAGDPFLLDTESRLSGAPLKREIERVLDYEQSLGRRPTNLAAMLAELAIGGPGVCALRALRRFFPERAQDSQVRRSAFRIARGLQSLFNQHDAMIAVQLLYPRRKAYWRQVLSYCIDGNLQALLDEQLHGDFEALAMSGKTLAEKVEDASRPLYDALSIRRATLDVTGLDRRRRRGGGSGGLRLRGRHALRFAEIKEADGKVSRLDHVRGAFNSPFRPFLLASTSVGQEGLDFHPWCHVVVHWNLPHSPVELEQREGRVHRYKGHAVRTNLARGLGLARLRELGMAGLTDPWERMFQLAGQGASANPLSPCWMFDGCEAPIKVRRVVPLIAMSREERLWPRLLDQVAIYRLVMGLPRQEELLHALEDNGLTPAQAQAWKIDLRPPPEAAKRGGA